MEKGVIELMERMGSGSTHQQGQEDSYTENAVSYEKLSPYLEDIKPGTLFFSDHGRAVSERFIQDTWKHCGIYLGSLAQVRRYWGKDNDLVLFLQKYYTSKDDYLIFDSSYTYGVAIHSIKELADLSHMSTLRRLLLFECGLDKEEWSQHLLNGKEHLGKDYDYFFVLDNEDALYCSEFLYYMLPIEKSKVVPSRKILGREFLLPSDLLRSLVALGESTGDFINKGTISKCEGQITHSLEQ